MKSARKPELLAPAGSSESLLAAVRCGADAVYLGGSSLNARRGADNFGPAELAQAVSFCHARNVRVFLALNTLVFDQERQELARAVEQACAAGVDAVIVQDLAVAAAVGRQAPELELHASTQMSVHNADGARALEQLGFRRVVLAREMTGDEIRRVIDSTSLEVECFVHGAHCMSVSGQCALSAMIGGRSGNRGLCAQPCRLPFLAGRQTHALSLRDLSLVARIPELRGMGVAALKIEGRMKRPEYVAAATTACRSALDGEPVDFAALEAVFSRGGFTDGYFAGKRDAGMFGVRGREDVAATAAVLKKLRALYKEEPRVIPISFSLRVREGVPVSLEARDGDGNAATARGELPSPAQTAPLTAEKAVSLLKKSGGTIFTICSIESDIDERLIVPSAQINALRRQVLEELTALREAPRPRAFRPEPLEEIAPHRPVDRPALRARLHRLEQLTGKVAALADELTLPLEELARMPDQALEPLADRLLVELPRVLFTGEAAVEAKLREAVGRGVTRVLAGNLGMVELAKRCGVQVCGDWGLNVTNTAALREYAAMGLGELTLSFELELRRIAALGGGLRRGMLAYGHLPLMALRNCPVRSATGCKSCGHGFPVLTDRLNNRFFVDCRCKVAELYNCVPLFLADRLEELAGVDFLTLYFTKESPEQCAELLAQYKSGGEPRGKMTRGLYYRKVR